MTDDAAQYNNRAAQSNMQQTACNQLNAMTQFQRAPTPIPQFHWSRLPGIPEAEVTQDMALRGACILSDRVETGRWAYGDDATAIYRAMHSAAPVPIVSSAEDAMRVALLRILGDMPSPSENPWERCRCIAAQALGYKTPGPMSQASLAADALLKEPAQSYVDHDTFLVVLQRRDEQIVKLQDTLKQRTDERDTANADLTELSAIRWNLVQELSVARFELKAAQDALAVAITPRSLPQAPDPIVNAIKPRETDRRMMGQ